MSESAKWVGIVRILMRLHKYGLAPWALHQYMYCDVLWHWVLFWFHLMRYFTHQRRISKKYGPFFSRTWLFKIEAKLFWSCIQFPFFSRATQEYCASKKESRTSFFSEEQGDLWRFWMIQNWSFRYPSIREF